MELKTRIAGLMKHEKWSPELIAKLLAPERELQLSHETIYKWIWTAKHNKRADHKEYITLCKYRRYTERQQKRSNQKDTRGVIKSRVAIDKRPEVVNCRTSIGDIQVDVMMGKNHESALLVMTAKTNLVTMLEKLESKNSEEVFQKMNRRLTNFDSS